MDKNCPLCALNIQKEKIFYQDNAFFVLRTKKLKGHKERIMIVYKRTSVQYLKKPMNTL